MYLYRINVWTKQNALLLVERKQLEEIEVYTADILQLKILSIQWNCRETSLYSHVEYTILLNISQHKNAEKVTKEVIEWGMLKK